MVSGSATTTRDGAGTPPPAEPATLDLCSASGPGPGGFFQVCEHLFGVAVGLYLFEDVLDFTVPCDDERGAGDAHDLLAVHVLFLQNTVGLGDLFVGVGKQGEGQTLFVGKFSLPAGGVGGDAKQHGAGLLNLCIGVAEPASFYGSTRGAGAGKKEQDHGFSAQIFQGDLFPVLVGQSEVGGFI